MIIVVHNILACKSRPSTLLLGYVARVVLSGEQTECTLSRAQLSVHLREINSYIMVIIF
jgi:hypothetical protein